ncbi:zinc ABC transporter substrate-binding protein [Candidatus Daviesbacteria bacterium]|nr:zinc ABC transporter substrate-binding protein [Candidatus Daviesbacteria bacterium]
MRNKIILIVVLLIAALIYQVAQTPRVSSQKIQIAASFYPLYFFASEIGKGKAEVFNITPSGIEPHDYDPSPQDIVRILESKLLIVNGLGFEPWVDKLKKELESIPIIDTSAGINQQSKDSHIWLSPVLAKSQVDKILQGYIQMDSSSRSYYEANAEELKRKLTELDNKFKQGFSSCKQNSFITSHAAFGYLAREYNLTQVPISGLSPQEEPSPAQMAKVTKFARENNIEYIFFENLVSPKLAETIAKEIGVQTLVLDPIEGISDHKNGKKNYFTIMEENLQNLKIALKCQ